MSIAANSEFILSPKSVKGLIILLNNIVTKLFAAFDMALNSLTVDVKFEETLLLDNSLILPLKLTLEVVSDSSPSPFNILSDKLRQTLLIAYSMQKIFFSCFPLSFEASSSKCLN